MRRVQKIGMVLVVGSITALTLSYTIFNSGSHTSVEGTTPSMGMSLSESKLSAFDPNTISYREMMAMGFDKRVAIAVLKYRSRGKVFEIAEEFALCYGVTDSMYQALRPYIVIGKQFKDSRSQPLVDAQQPYEQFRIDTVGAAYLTTIGFTLRQAEALIEYRNSGEHGIRSMEELRDCWVVSPQMADSLARYVIFPKPKPYGGKIEINSADISTLESLRGVGPKTAAAIVEYRNLLGGYVSIKQLSELKCVTSENFAQFYQEICCDSCVFSKIDINFAPASELELHPYMTREAINKVIKLRKSKGGWKSFEEIVNDNIFTLEQAASLEPYLYFDTTAFDNSEENS